MNKIFQNQKNVDDVQEFAENQESFSMRFFPSAFVEPKLLYVSKTFTRQGSINCRSGVSMKLGVIGNGGFTIVMVVKS